MIRKTFYGNVEKQQQQQWCAHTTYVSVNQHECAEYFMSLLLWVFCYCFSRVLIFIFYDVIVCRLRLFTQYFLVVCVCSASFLVTHEIQFADALGRKWAHTLKAIWIHTHKLVVMELMSLLSLSVSRSAPLYRFKYQRFFLHWNWIFFVLSVHFTMYSALFSIVIRGERKTSKIVSHTWKWKALVKHAPEYIPHSYRKTK